MSPTSCPVSSFTMGVALTAATTHPSAGTLRQARVNYLNLFSLCVTCNVTCMCTHTHIHTHTHTHTHTHSTYITHPFPSPQDSWVHCNDARISRCTQDEVLASQAYILFYVRGHGVSCHEVPTASLPAPPPHDSDPNIEVPSAKRVRFA